MVNFLSVLFSQVWTLVADGRALFRSALRDLSAPGGGVVGCGAMDGLLEAGERLLGVATPRHDAAYALRNSSALHTSCNIPAFDGAHTAFLGEFTQDQDYAASIQGALLLWGYAQTHLCEELPDLGRVRQFVGYSQSSVQGSP